MTGVYLVLRAFNYAEVEEKYGIFIPQHLRTKAIHIKALLEDSPYDIDYFDEAIDLNSKSKTANIHKSGIILCKLYEKDNIPSDEILIKDFKQLIEIQDYVYDNYSDNKRYLSNTHNKNDLLKQYEDDLNFFNDLITGFNEEFGLIK